MRTAASGLGSMPHFYCHRSTHCTSCQRGLNSSYSRHALSAMYPGVKSLVSRSDAIPQVGLDATWGMDPVFSALVKKSGPYFPPKCCFHKLSLHQKSVDLPLLWNWVNKIELNCKNWRTLGSNQVLNQWPKPVTSRVTGVQVLSTVRHSNSFNPWFVQKSSSAHIFSKTNVPVQKYLKKSCSY
jgi:hypothetical protein